MRLLRCVVLLAVSLYLLDSALGQTAVMDPCGGNYMSYTFPLNAWLNDSTHNFGFSYAWINEYNNPPLCLQFNNVGNHAIQILAETISSNVQICIKDQGNSVNNQNGGAVDYCSTGTLHSCFNALTNQNNLNVYIYCSSNCPTSGFALYYRAVFSTLSWANAAAASDSALSTLDMWCMNEVASVRYQFPSNINAETTTLTTEDVYTPSSGDSTPSTVNSAVSIAPTSIAAFLFAALFAAITLL